MSMTSTSINVGLKEGKASSSRVLRPPGGGHTDIFGGEPEPQRTGRGRPRQSPLASNEEAFHCGKHNGTHETKNGTTPEVAETINAPEPIAPSPEKVDAKTESPNFEPKPEPPKCEPQTEAPKRVRVPPGGFSSGLW